MFSEYFPKALGWPWVVSSVSPNSRSLILSWFSFLGWWFSVPVLCSVILQNFCCLFGRRSSCSKRWFMEPSLFCMHVPCRLREKRPTSLTKCLSVSSTLITGILVTIYIYCLHHNMKVWPNLEVRKLRIREGGGISQEQNLLPAPYTGHSAPSWVGSKDLNPSYPGPAALPSGVWPFSVFTRLCPTQPLILSFFRRTKVRQLCLVMGWEESSISGTSPRLWSSVFPCDIFRHVLCVGVSRRGLHKCMCVYTKER